MFAAIMDNEAVPFGSNFSGMRTLLKVHDETIWNLFDKID